MYLAEADVTRAAEFLGMTADAFQAKYIYRTKNVIRLRKPRSSQCHFLKADGCAIHPAKPTQCRIFPFWPELVDDRHAWRTAARECPGIGKGELIQIGAARALAQEMRQAYPFMY